MQNAKRFVRSLQANGGTEILSALQRALPHIQDTERLRQVVFITDGAVGNESELFQFIEQHLQQSRLFTIGIGSAPNSFFMSEAAMMGKGTYTFIGNVAQVKQKMQNLFAKLTQPVLSDLQLLNAQDAKFYPSNIPDLYHGEPIILSYRANTIIDSLTISGALKNSPWKQTLVLQGGAKTNGLNVLWAREKITQLERYKHKSRDIQQTNRDILTTALEHHIVSSMTSLIAIDNQIIRPQALAKRAGTLPQTSTTATLRLLLSVIIGLFSLTCWLVRKRG